MPAAGDTPSRRVPRFRTEPGGRGRAARACPRHCGGQAAGIPDL